VQNRLEVNAPPVLQEEFEDAFLKGEEVAVFEAGGYLTSQLF
jgi:hypothetical protein